MVHNRWDCNYSSNCFFSDRKNHDNENQSTEIANLKAQLDSLQNQLESEKQQSAESSSSSTTNEKEKPKEESPQIFKVVNVVVGIR